MYNFVLFSNLRAADAISRACILDQNIAKRAQVNRGGRERWRLFTTWFACQ